MGRLFHLGDNKKAFSTEVFAIYQAFRIFDVRQQSGCKPGSLALTRMAVGRDGLSEEVTEVFIGRRRTNSNAYG